MSDLQDEISSVGIHADEEAAPTKSSQDAKADSLNQDGPIHRDGGGLEQLIAAKIAARKEPTMAVTDTPNNFDLLLWYQVAAVVANRMIGTGIFNMPTTVIRENHNIGSTFILWGLGYISSIAGTLMYVEYGLTIPRRLKDLEKNETAFFPRSGGELNYLNYLVDTKTYHRSIETKNDILWHRFLASCTFGWMFVLVGNAAANSIAFAVHLMQAVDFVPPKGIIQVIAIGVSTIVCIIHGMGRRFGVHLNTSFAVVKFSILWLIIGCGCAVMKGSISRKEPEQTPKINFNSLDMGATGGGGLGFIRSYISVLFAFGGFQQANYVLGEVRKPKRIFKWTVVITVGVIGVTYLLVNMVYFAVVPIPTGATLHDEFSIIKKFFEMTLGRHAMNGEAVGRICANSFTAFSSLGNIIVVTFTASRVKQEIAKEGVIPFARFFRGNFDIIDAIKRRTCRRGKNSNDQIAEETAKRLSGESAFEPIPLPALALHCVFTWFLILTTFKIDNPKLAYEPLAGIYAYNLDAMVSFGLGVGLLIMRCKPNSAWNDISAISQNWLSIIVAIIVILTNGFPLVALFIPDPDAKVIPWYTVPTIGWAVLGTGLIYWGLFRIVISLLQWRRGKIFIVKREPILEVDEDDESVCIGEINYQLWDKKIEALDRGVPNSLGQTSFEMTSGRV